MPLVMAAAAAPRRRVTVEVNGPAVVSATPSGSPHSGEPATPLHNHADAAEPPDASPTVVVHTFVEPIHLLEGDDDGPSTVEEASSFIAPLKRSPSPLLTARSTPLSKLSLLVPLFFAALSLALWIWYLVAYLDELSGWDNASCDSSDGGSTTLQAPGANSTAVDSGIVFPSSTGVAAATETTSTRGDVAKIYHDCVVAAQLIGVLGTLLFGFFLDRSSGWVSGLGVFLDALLLSVFFWGVYLYLSATVCVFAFFKVTLVYCIVQMAVLVVFVNTLGNYQRARCRAEQTVVQSLPSPRNKSPSGSSRGGAGGGGVELARANGTGSARVSAAQVSGLPFSPTPSRLPNPVVASTLPTLQPFQHPAFPIDAPVPLFVVQMHPDQRAPAVAPMHTEAAANAAGAAAASSASSAPAASASASASGAMHTPVSPPSADLTAPAPTTVSVRSPAAAAAAAAAAVEQVHELDGEFGVYDANQLQYQSV